MSKKKISVLKNSRVLCECSVSNQQLRNIKCLFWAGDVSQGVKGPAPLTTHMVEEDKQRLLAVL